MRAYWVVALFTVLVLPASAAVAPKPLASIFKAERQTELCSPNDGKIRFVDPLRLAQAIADDVPVPSSLLDRANESHKGDGNVSSEEFIYAVIEERPFGPKAQPKPNGQVEAATKGIRDRMGMLTTWLELGGAIKEGYHVVLHRTQSPLASYLFVDNPIVQIQCRKVENDAAITGEASKPGPVVKALKEIGDKIVVRKKKDQLAKPREDLKKLDPAELSFRQDKKADADAFQTNFVIGYVFNPIDIDSSVFKVVPYLKYEKTGNSDSNKKDVNVLTPGILFDMVYLGQNVGFEAGIYPEGVLDFEQNAETFKLNAFIGPSFRDSTRKDAPILFGGYMPMVGPFAFRPDIQALVEYGHVLDSGESSDLKDKDSYAGLGGEFELKLEMPLTPILQDFVITARYRYVDLFSAELSRTKRLAAGITYSLPSSDNITLGFEYVDGNNLETLQDEEFWKVALGFRY